MRDRISDYGDEGGCPCVKGGQGREDESMVADAKAWAFAALGMLIFVSGVVIGCSAAFRGGL